MAAWAAVPVPASFLHEPFLERAADPALADSGQQALGAFLTLRMIDRFAVGAAPMPAPALEYQTHATRDYLLDLRPQAAEAGHLLEIVRVADAVRCGSNRRLLWAPLQAYGYWLEQELRLAEALDVVDTAVRLNDGRAVSEEIAAPLQRGRILRLLGRFDEAREAYETARAKAMSIGDMHSALLGRIGDAIVIRQLGNLSASEESLRAILTDAEDLGDRDAQARANHDLGLVLLYRERTQAGVPHLYQAFELYEQEAYKLRALSDVGEALKRLGHYSAAEDAFTLTLTDAATAQMQACTMIALLELSALTGNRVAFLSWGKRVSALREQLPPEREVDLDLQLGLGYASFDQMGKAEQYLRQATERARLHKLNDYLFRADEALREVRERAQEKQPAGNSPAGRFQENSEIGAIAAKLCALRAAG